MRAYFDNVVASGLTTGDLQPGSEMQAVTALERARANGVIEIWTSRESWREQERTRDANKRAQLAGARAGIPVVVKDHVVLGSGSHLGPLGTVSTYPLVSDVTDEALFADLKRIGLKNADARHFMYAHENGCDRFVTLDPDFTSRRQALEARCPSLRIVTPSQLANGLQGHS